jgi:hypothetical protein
MVVYLTWKSGEIEWHQYEIVNPAKRNWSMQFLFFVRSFPFSTLPFAFFDSLLLLFLFMLEKSGEPLTIDGNPEAKVGVPIILFLGFLDTVSYWLGFWIFSKIRRSGKASNHWYAIFLWFTIPACISIIHIPLLILVEIYYAREKQKQ